MVGEGGRGEGGGVQIPQVILSNLRVSDSLSNAVTVTGARA